MIKELENSKISESLYCSNGTIYSGVGEPLDTPIGDVKWWDESLGMYVIELSKMNNLLWADDVIALAEWIKKLPENPICTNTTQK